jgi:hypothetical protein
VLLLVVVQHTWDGAAIAVSYSQVWCSSVHMLLLLVLFEEGWRACAATAGSYSQYMVVLQRAYDVAGVRRGAAYLFCCC